MRASPWSLSLLMVILGVMLFYFARQEELVAHTSIPLPTYLSSAALLLRAGDAEVCRQPTETPEPRPIQGGPRNFRGLSPAPRFLEMR